MLTQYIAYIRIQREELYRSIGPLELPHVTKWSVSMSINRLHNSCDEVQQTCRRRLVEHVVPSNTLYHQVKPQCMRWLIKLCFSLREPHLGLKGPESRAFMETACSSAITMTTYFRHATVQVPVVTYILLIDHVFLFTAYKIVYTVTCSSIIP